MTIPPKPDFLPFGQATILLPNLGVHSTTVPQNQRDTLSGEFPKTVVWGVRISPGLPCFQSLSNPSHTIAPLVWGLLTTFERRKHLLHVEPFLKRRPNPRCPQSPFMSLLNAGNGLIGAVTMRNT